MSAADARSARRTARDAIRRANEMSQELTRYNDIMAGAESWNSHVSEKSRVQWEDATPARRTLVSAVSEKTLQEESKGLI